MHNTASDSFESPKGPFGITHAVFSALFVLILQHVGAGTVRTGRGAVPESGARGAAAMFFVIDKIEWGGGYTKSKYIHFLICEAI